VRREVEARFDGLGETAFRAGLGRLDPAAAERIFPGDRQRLVRAMAVAEATGRALSDWQAATRPPEAEGYARLVLEPPREALYARCDARLEAMVQAGALEEARTLLDRRLDPSLPLMKAVGLRELGRRLSGELSLEAATALAAQETRRYAKRQTTWFRNQAAAWPRFAGFGEAADVGAILSKNGSA
jgi:tRNA dimethylallyltransferase